MAAKHALKWRKVEIDSTLQSQMEGFGGLEEITDYSISSSKNGIFTIKPSNPSHEGHDARDPKRKKRKNAADKPEAVQPVPQATVDNAATPKPKHAKKKSKQVDKAPIVHVAPSTEAAPISTALPSTKGKKHKAKQPSSAAPAVAIPPAPEIDTSAWQALGVSDPVCAALGALGFAHPTPIQAAVLPKALVARRDIVGAAETGSGKTLAFGIPIVQHLMQSRKYGDECYSVAHSISTDHLSALVVVPTRELAIQVCDHLKAIGKPCGVHAIPIVGGLALAKQERLLARRPDVVVGTPGRLWDVISSGHPHFQHLPSLRFLIIDEADRMLDTGHFEELSSIIERCNAPAAHTDALFDSEPAAAGQDDDVLGVLPPDRNRIEARKRQTFVFSATLTLETRHAPMAVPHKGKGKGPAAAPKDTLQRIIEKCELRPKYVVADLSSKDSKVARGVSEARIVCTAEDRDGYLYYLLRKFPGRTLVFVNSIACMRRLTALLSLLALSPMALHAHMQQRQRLRSLERFRERESGVLIATDVAARGLDIKGIDHVVHYQLPRQPDIYVHRAGRTARANTEGLSITLLTPEDVPNYQRIVKQLRANVDLPAFPVELKYLNAINKRVSLASRIEKLQSATSTKRQHNEWAIKAAEEMDIVLDEFDEVLLDEDDVAPHQQQAAKLKAELAALLADPIMPVHVSKAVAATAGRAEPALQPLLSAASVRALDLAKTRAAQLKPATPSQTPRIKRRMPRNRRFKLAQAARQGDTNNTTDAAEPDAEA